MNRACNVTGGKRYINRRRQQLIFRRLSVIAAIITGTFMMIGASKLATHAEEATAPHYYKYYTSIIVMPGDTLPSIAAAYGENYASVDAHVSEIMASNHLTDETVYPGSSLIIPYYSTLYIH